ncbi:MAG: NYN domain-containing protein [Candidatus Magasanikbacteria bacterium]|nr:NYN domain-containing protein [Candidatus Magasanikbacteria bacterium]
MNKIKRVMIFIDGSNFYFKMKSLGIRNLKKYGYHKLCENLSGNREIASIGYYIGVVRAKPNDEKGQKLRKNQVDLFNHLRNENVFVYKGYLMKNDGVYHEKGVDVKIAAKQLGKSVEYVGFGHQPSLALVSAASRSRLLLVEELEKFVFET